MSEMRILWPWSLPGRAQDESVGDKPLNLPANRLRFGLVALEV
jgi:hypothetical protein